MDFTLGFYLVAEGGTDLGQGEFPLFVFIELDEDVDRGTFVTLADDPFLHGELLVVVGVFLGEKGVYGFFLFIPFALGN